ncbi:UDP-glucosyltransferase 2-like [Eupeodes corollae]|uniref:UDP-glucosyltransferase 2-like n=1 Tax=Eupeodes corollae TaxID=290404 RepID=UPI0024928E6C|nr:UDP-glucosyltransferase 2-like [Eupeodes corollae]
MSASEVIKVICVLISIFHNGYSANILGLMGCTSHSHHLWNEVIVNALAERGHSLTVASVDENNSPHPNVTYIHLEEAYNTVADYYKDSDANFDTYGPFANLRLLYNFKLLECKGIFQSKGFEKASNLAEEKFDLILFDISAGPCIFRLIQKYPEIPVVAVSAFKMDPYILEIVGGHSYPGYVPYFLDHQDVPMNLWNRLTNSATYAFAYFYRKYITESAVESLAPDDPKPTLQSLQKRVNMTLINTHPAMDYAQSLPPNVIEVGGLHIKEPQKLPEDINAFIDSGNRGAILISLGSNTLVETIGQNRIDAILFVIRSMPQYNFLWKIEKEDIFEDAPKNLLIRKWLPQNDILANSRVHAFFTHAGGLSMQEATWHGVPVIAMPLFLDQFVNARNAQLKGCGLEVNFETLNNETLLQAFTKILSDQNYKLQMQKLQKKFQDRQNKPLDTALWWIEYFLRNPNAEHLTPSSRDISYFAANSFDIFIIFLIICIVFSIVFVKIIRIFLKCSKKMFSKLKDKNVPEGNTLTKKTV